MDSPQKISARWQKERPPVAFGTHSRLTQSKPVIRVHPLLYTFVYTHICILFTLFVQAQFCTGISLDVYIYTDISVYANNSYHFWKCKGLPRSASQNHESVFQPGSHIRSNYWTPSLRYNTIPQEGIGPQRSMSKYWDYWFYNTN